MWHFCRIINPLLFFAKREISFEVSSFGGSLFLGGIATFCDIILLLSEVRFFRGVVAFGTSGNNSDPTLWKIPVSSASDRRSMSGRAKIRNHRQPLYSKRPHDLPEKEI